MVMANYSNQLKRVLSLVAMAVIVGCGSDNPVDQPIIEDNDPNLNNTCEVMASNLEFDDDVNILGLGFIVNDISSVYMYTYASSSGGTISKISKSSNEKLILAEQLGGVNGIAVDDTYLYWLEYEIASGSGQVKKVQKNGTGAIEILAEGFPQQPDGSQSSFNVFFPNGIALDSESLFWGEQVGGSAIRKIAKTGGPVVDIARGEVFNPMALTVDSENIYVVDANNNVQILQISKSMGAKSILSSGFASSEAFSNLELNNNILYWSEITNNGNTYQLSLSTGEIKTVKGSLTNPRSVVVDGSNIYIAAGNGIYQINKASGIEATIVCSNISVPFTVNIDGSFIYIVDNPLGKNGMLVKKKL